MPQASLRESSQIPHDEKIALILQLQLLDILDVEGPADGVQNDLRASLVGRIVGHAVNPPLVVDTDQKLARAEAGAQTVQPSLGSDLSGDDPGRLQPCNELDNAD